MVQNALCRFHDANYDLILCYRVVHTSHHLSTKSQFFSCGSFSYMNPHTRASIEGVVLSMADMIYLLTTSIGGGGPIMGDLWALKGLIEEGELS